MCHTISLRPVTELFTGVTANLNLSDLMSHVIIELLRSVTSSSDVTDRTVDQCHI